ncbi:MAG: glycosyltransferase family 2 protein [Ignavibacteriaceae bacterium]
MSKVAAIVVLYNPDWEVLENIKSYINQVDILFAVDNSAPVINKTILDQILLFDHVRYICNHTNLGIAAALNIGAQKAVNEGFEYLLTMDQDSIATPNMVEKLIECCSGNEFIGLAAPEHLTSFSLNCNLREKIYENESVVMTSGNIINLAAFNKTGGYNEKLFIDYVDYDYCIRLKENNYQIVRVKNAVLFHNVGKLAEKKIGFKKVYPTNHNPIRLYYQTRNRFYLRSIYKNKYSSFFKDDLISFRNNLIKILLFEEKKIAKLKMIIKGYKDYRKHKFGKYQEK